MLQCSPSMGLTGAAESTPGIFIAIDAESRQGAATLAGCLRGQYEELPKELRPFSGVTVTEAGIVFRAAAVACRELDIPISAGLEIAPNQEDIIGTRAVEVLDRPNIVEYLQTDDDVHRTVSTFGGMGMVPQRICGRVFVSKVLEGYQKGHLVIGDARNPDIWVTRGMELFGCEIPMDDADKLPLHVHCELKVAATRMAIAKGAEPSADGFENIVASYEASIQRRISEDRTRPHYSYVEPQIHTGSLEEWKTLALRDGRTKMLPHAAYDNSVDGLVEMNRFAYQIVATASRLSIQRRSIDASDPTLTSAA